jgi:hypothetical protein
MKLINHSAHRSEHYGYATVAALNSSLYVFNHSLQRGLCCLHGFLVACELLVKMDGRSPRPAL